MLCYTKNINTSEILTEEEYSSMVFREAQEIQTEQIRTGDDVESVELIYERLLSNPDLDFQVIDEESQYVVRDRQGGNEIESFSDPDDARKCVIEFEEQDISDGISPTL